MGREIVRIDAIFFDFDGVMADTMPYHLPAWKQVIDKEFGFHFNPMTVKLNEGRPALEIAAKVFESAGFSYSASDVQKLVDQKNLLFRATHNATVYPENVEIIRLAHEKNHKVGLVTGTQLKNVDTLLPKDLLQKLDVIIVDGDTMKGKPNPEPYLEAANRIDAEPQKCLVIENAPLGIKAAKHAGMICAAVKTTLSEEHLQAADVTFENHAELLSYVKKIL